MRLRFTIGAVAVMGIVLSVPMLWAQDLGDVARRDRERRSRLAIHGPVLTNEDVARERILTPELKARILTGQLEPGVPASPDALSVTSISIAPARWLDEIVPPPVTVGMVQQLGRAAHKWHLEIVPPATIAAQTLPARTPVYSEAVVAVKEEIGEPVSLGEYARRLRTHRAENIVVRAPEATRAETNYTAANHDGISLGEYVRQLEARHAAQPLVVQAPVLSAPSADAGDAVSLSEYVRQLRTVGSLPAAESANITLLPPRVAAPPRQPEISLGEYARALRIRRAAEEYARLLARDEAVAITPDTPPIRYHEIRPSAPAPMLGKRRTVKRNVPQAPQGHIAVTVRRGDSLWRLARTYLGAGARWQSISFLRRHSGSPQLIRAGEVVLIPVSDAQRARAFALARRNSTSRNR